MGSPTPKQEIQMVNWNVFVKGRCIGQVSEVTEEHARCAALHQFGIGDEEWEEAKGQRENFGPNIIRPSEEFSVSRA